MSTMTTLSLLPIEALAGLVRDRFGRGRDEPTGVPAEFRRSEAFPEDLDSATLAAPRRPLPSAPLAGYVGVVAVALVSTAGLLFAGVAPI